MCCFNTNIIYTQCTCTFNITLVSIFITAQLVYLLLNSVLLCTFDVQVTGVRSIRYNTIACCTRVDAVVGPVQSGYLVVKLVGTDNTLAGVSSSRGQCPTKV